MLVGWQFDIAVFKYVLPASVTMKANTALGLMALSTALWCHRRENLSARHRFMARLTVSFSGVMGLITLAEYLFDANLWIDEALFKDPAGITGRFPPGRLAPITALIFLSISAGSLLVDSPRRGFNRAAHFLYFSAFICAFQAFFGYICGVNYTFGSASYTQIAVHTALASGILALGFLAARPHTGFMSVITAESLGGYMARRLLAIAVVVPPLINYLERVGQSAGLYDSDFGVLVRMISNVVFFVVIALRLTSALHDVDMSGRQSEKSRRDLEDALRTKELSTDLNAAMAHALAGIAKLDADGTLLTVNPLLAQMLGCDGAALIDKSLLEIADAGDRSILRAMHQKMLTTGRAEAEIRGRHHGAGEVYLHIVAVHVEATSTSMENSYLFAKDISERKRAEAALSASRAQLAEAQQIAQIGSWAIDLNSGEMRVSDEFYRIYGLAPANTPTVRELFRSAIHPLDRDRSFKISEDAISTGQPFRLDFRIFRPSGEIRYVHSRAETIKDDAGKVTKMVGTIQDVTDLRKVEAELIAAREAALEASRLKSEFLANMSHEIRTPINGVIGMTSLLADTKLGVEQAEFVETIRRSADALLTIINDILDVSKIEAGKLDLENVDFDLDEVISDVEKVVSLQALEKNLRFSIREPAELEHLIQGDPGRIRQVLMNLLSNAIKFTAGGHVFVKVEVQHASDSQPKLRFTIEDSGIGIEQSALSKLFRPFTQADASTTRRFGGTGLGLSICKQLVELMGGSIGASSTPGNGSTFWFDLPLKLGKQRRIAIPPNAAQHASAQFSGARILIAEDNAINQKVARGMLEKFGCKAHCVGNGREALESLRDMSFDLVLMDCQMPELDGYDATAAVRQSGETWAQIPIIAMTANAIKGDRERCIAAGMNDYIAKPVKTVELAAVLKKWLNAKQD